MKKIILGLMVLVLTSFTILITINTITFNKAKTDVVTNELNEYFDKVEIKEDSNKLNVNTSLQIDDFTLDSIQFLSTQKGTVTAKYDLTIQEDSSLVLKFTLITNNQVIEELYNGYYVVKEDNEKDIMFEVDNELILLSELNNDSSVKQTGWFKSKVKNIFLKVRAVNKPVERVLNAVRFPSIEIGRNMLAYRNRKYNRSLEEPNDLIYGQKYFEKWKFGISNLSYAGCEVISIYNLLRTHNKGIKLADLIYMVEMKRVSMALGKLGANPYQLGTILKKYKIEYKKVNRYSDFERLISNDKDYEVILASWNEDKVFTSLHTIYMNKDVLNEKILTYNLDTEDKSATKLQITNFKKVFADKNVDFFITAYFIDN